MAGSYQHCRKEDGGFDFDLIENMGDAHEACEEMFWMIHVLTNGDPEAAAKAWSARNLIKYGPGPF